MVSFIVVLFHLTARTCYFVIHFTKAKEVYIANVLNTKFLIIWKNLHGKKWHTIYFVQQLLQNCICQIYKFKYLVLVEYPDFIYLGAGQTKLTDKDIL